MIPAGLYAIEFTPSATATCAPPPPPPRPPVDSFHNCPPTAPPRQGDELHQPLGLVPVPDPALPSPALIRIIPVHTVRVRHHHHLVQCVGGRKRQVHTDPVFIKARPRALRVQRVVHHRPALGRPLHDRHVRNPERRHRVPVPLPPHQRRIDEHTVQARVEPVPVVQDVVLSDQREARPLRLVPRVFAAVQPVALERPPPGQVAGRIARVTGRAPGRPAPKNSRRGGPPPGVRAGGPRAPVRGG